MPVLNTIAESSRNGSGRTVLLMDRDNAYLACLSELLARLGYKIYTAQTVGEGIHAAGSMQPALIITSLHLADKSGLAILQTLKADSVSARIPCFVLRNQDEIHTAQECIASGAATCFHAPVDAMSLYRAIQSAIEKTPRFSPRIRMRLPVKVDTRPYDRHGGSHTLDLSESGMFLWTLMPAPPNTALVFRINLSGLIIPLEGKVIYSGKPTSDGTMKQGVGIEFTKISEKDRNLLGKFVANEIARAMTP